jgi:pyrrolidone-carboxylate peptidase
MNERIKELWEQAVHGDGPHASVIADFAELIIKECIDKIETHRIPVGNSAAGEMACEWTYSALNEIRDEIKEHFGVEE